MSQPVIEIASSSSNIALCSTNPQLMPFHVGYTGPAPISTFFRVHEQEEPSLAPSASTSTPNGSKTSLKKRLMSAFRGRQVVGTDISLPEGYTGLVLRSESQPRAARKSRHIEATQAAKARGSRRSKAIVVEKEPEQYMDVDEDLSKDGDDDERETKILLPVQTFDAIRVWNADVPVDEGRDEYIRALREWTALAASVSRLNLNGSHLVNAHTVVQLHKIENI